jgi:hypothetical protein
VSSQAPERSGKRARREEARRQRLELQRRLERRRRLRGLAIRIAVPIALVGAGLLVVNLVRSRSPATAASYVSGGPTIDPASLPGIRTGSLPWPPEIAHLRERLQAEGLQVLAHEGTVLHIHQHLDLFVNGRRVPVPADIGIDASAGFLSPIHTHDTSGVIHVESPVVTKFTLGEFFDVWGVRFTRSCIGGYCTSGDRTLRVYVNGHLATGDPRRIELTAHEEIAVVYGTSAEAPDPIPASYTFPIGE